MHPRSYASRARTTPDVCRERPHGRGAAEVGGRQWPEALRPDGSQDGGRLPRRSGSQSLPHGRSGAVASSLLAEPSAAAAALAAPAALGARDSRGPVVVQLALATDRVQPQQYVDATLFVSVAPPWELVAPQARRRDVAPISVTLLTSSLNADAPRYPTAQTVRRRWSPGPVPSSPAR